MTSRRCQGLQHVAARLDPRYVTSVGNSFPSASQMEALLMAINNFIPSDVGFWSTNKWETVGNLGKQVE